MDFGQLELSPNAGIFWTNLNMIGKHYLTTACFSSMRLSFGPGVWKNIEWFVLFVGGSWVKHTLFNGGLVAKSWPTLATPWPVVSSVMGFSGQEYWSGLPFPSSGDLPDPETELHWQVNFLSLGHLIIATLDHKEFDKPTHYLWW